MTKEQDDLVFLRSANVTLVQSIKQYLAGNIPRPLGKRYRKDGEPSKQDQCCHGVRMYEDCGGCIDSHFNAVFEKLGVR